MFILPELYLPALMKKIVLFFLLMFFNIGFSQNEQKIILSLKDVLKANPSDSIKTKTYSDLCWYYRNIDQDSAFYYGEKALGLSKKNNNPIGEAQAYNDIGILHFGLGNYQEALNLYKKSLGIRNKLIDSSGIAALYNKIGLVYQNTFKMDSAIFYATKALKIYKAQKNLKYVVALKNNIANIHKGLKQYEKALESHLEIALINEKIKDTIPLIRSYNNIGNAYLFLKDTTNCILYYKKGITLAEAKNYNKMLASLYNNYGGVLHSEKRFAEAKNMVNKSLNLRKELNDNYGIASTSLHLAGLYLDLKEFGKSKNHLFLGLRMSQELNANELKLDAYDKLTSYYAYKNKADSVIYYKDLYKALKDSVLSKQVLKEVAEVEEKYNSVERENKILIQRAEITEKELRIDRKNTQLIGLFIVSVLLTILGYLLYNQQKLKNRQLQKESELKEAIARIETQNKLQEQRLRISRDLHDNIGAQLTFVISSIENLQYGFKIKNEKLTEKLKGISGFTKDTIYELRDTIWAMNKNEISLEDLEVRISNFVEKADKNTKDIRFTFMVDDKVNKQREFTSVIGMNVYRIIQEAVNNAFKYAKAQTVDVSISQDNNQLHIKVQDDGKGFDIDTVQKGNGLNNMKKRAKEINANIAINSELKKGATINLTLPL